MNSTHPMAGNGANWKAVIVERSAETKAAMVRQLEARGFNVAATLERPNHAAVEVRAHRAHLLIIELEHGDEAILRNLETLASEARDLHVIVTAPAAEADLILRVLRAGATEFLVRPVSSEDFSRALDRIVKSLTPLEEASGQVFAVYSGKGGIGNTTLAVNLACSLAKQHPNERVALIDMVMHGGDIPVFLDLNPHYTISDLLEKGDRIDRQLLEKVMQRHNGGFWVLPEPGQPEEAETMRGDQVAEIVSRLRSSFDFVVIDCEHQLTDRTLAILDTADKIMLLTVLNVPAVRQLQRTLGVFERLGYADHKIQVLVNRHNPKDVLRVRDVEKSLDRPVHWQLPNDYRASIDAITRGKPLLAVAPRSRLTDSLERLAATLTNHEAPDRPKDLGTRMRAMLQRATGK